MFRACSAVAEEHIMIAPWGKGISAGNGNTLRAGIAINSA
ncbi:hypothetical protein SBV1_120018 [Verrucomicrobia bacterium]|nr:hypothetical protein SBV1_120018 [Verrucomicrobiota bacterium]